MESLGCFLSALIYIDIDWVGVKFTRLALKTISIFENRAV